MPEVARSSSRPTAFRARWSQERGTCVADCACSTRARPLVTKKRLWKFDAARETRTRGTSSYRPCAGIPGAGRYAMGRFDASLRRAHSSRRERRGCREA